MRKFLDSPFCHEIKRYSGWSDARIIFGGALCAATLIGSIILQLAA